MPSPSEGGDTLYGKRPVLLCQSIAVSAEMASEHLTLRPHLIVPEHGCAFELQNHREYGVTSRRAKGVHEKNLMARNNLSL